MRRLHPATMIVAFLPKLADSFRQMLPVIGISLLGGRGDRSELFVSLIGVLGGFGAIGAYVTTRFEIADGQIVHRSGWIFRRDRRIPLDQIQNVGLRQGPLERLLKVMTLEIETAAGKGAELRLAVLSEPDAEQLRVELMAERFEPAHEAPVEEIYRASKGDIWLGALTENHPVALLFTVLPLLGIARFGAAIDFWAALPIGLRWLVGIAATVLALGAGWAFGAVRYVLKYGGFSVRREPGTTRVSYGLITKVQVAIRPSRIEYAVITTTPWQRIFRRETIAVGTAGSFGEQGTIAVMALMMPRAKTAATLRTMLPELDTDALSWQRFPKRYVRVVFGRGLLGFLVLLALSVPFVILAHRIPMVWFVALLPVLALGGLIDGVAGARRAGYAFDGKALAVRQGFFRQKTEIIPMGKVETVTERQPPWWRGPGYVTLWAKAMIHAVGLPVVPRAVADEVLCRLAELSQERTTLQRAPLTSAKPDGLAFNPNLEGNASSF